MRASSNLAPDVFYGILVVSSESVGVGVFWRFSGFSFESEGRSVGRAVGRLVGLAILAGCAIIPRIHSCRTLTLYHQATIHCEGWFFGGFLFCGIMKLQGTVRFLLPEPATPSVVVSCNIPINR